MCLNWNEKDYKYKFSLLCWLTKAFLQKMFKPAKWKTFIYVLKGVCPQWSKWLGSMMKWLALIRPE